MQLASQIDDLSDAELAAALDAVRGMRDKERKKARWEWLMQSGTDAEIMEEAERMCFRCAPITFARNYGNAGQGNRELIHGHHKNPRRPVIMRGALHVCFERYSLSVTGRAPSGWAVYLLKRAIRASRLTILSNEEYQPFYESLCRRIERKYCPHRAFRSYAPSYLGRNDVLIKGVFRSLSDSELSNVKALHAIIRKTGDLDKRITMARRHMQQRLAQ